MLSLILLLVKKALAEGGMALNRQTLEETLAIFRVVEKEIKEDMSQNVATVNKISNSNNRFNPDPNCMLKRSCQAAGEKTREEKKARVEMPIVSPSSSYSGGYGGNTTKVYCFTFSTRILVVYLAKGSANGDLGWFLMPMKRIKSELSQPMTNSQSRAPNSLVSLLQIVDMMPLRDRDSNIERPKKYPWKGTRSLFNHGYVHVAPTDALVDDTYASEYVNNFIKVINENFPNYRIEYGGNAAEENGEMIQSMDDIFMHHDVARFCAKVFGKEINNNSFFVDSNVSSYIRRHPNPAQLILLNNGNNGMN